MQLFCQLTIGLADLVLRRVRLHAQDSVGILAHVALLSGWLIVRYSEIAPH